MNYFILPALFAIGINSIIFLILYTRKNRQDTFLSFVAFLIFISIIQTFTILLNSKLLLLINFALISLIPAGYIILIKNTLESSLKPLDFVIAIVSIAIALIFLTGLPFSTFLKYEVIPAFRTRHFYYILQVIYIVLLLTTTIYSFLKYIRESNGIKRTRLYYFFVSLTAFIITYTILSYIEIIIEQPIYIFYNLIFIFIVFSHSIPFYSSRLKRVYLFNKLILEFFFTTLVLAVEGYIIITIFKEASSTAIIVSIIVFSISVILFKPTIDRAVDYFLISPASYIDILHSVENTINRCNDIETLKERVTSSLKTELGIINATLCVDRNELQEQVNVNDSQIKQLNQLSHLNGYYDADVLGSFSSHYSFLFPLDKKNVFRSLLLKDFEKKSGRILNREDIEILKTITKSLNTKLENICIIKTLSQNQEKLKKSINRQKELQGEITQAKTLSALGELIAGIAHELRNPLGAIRNSTDLLKVSTKKQKEIKKIISDEIDKMNLIIIRFLEFAKPQKLKKEDVNLSTFFNETVKQFKNKEKIEFLIDIPDSLFLSLDPDTFRQAVINIIQNSIDSLNGLGKIKVYSTKDKLYGDTFNIINIEDNGPGINSKDLERLFDPFFTKKTNGIGLGLSITFKIIELHQGHIRVESKPGRYTRFKIYLP